MLAHGLEFRLNLLRDLALVVVQVENGGRYGEIQDGQTDIPVVFIEHSCITFERFLNAHGCEDELKEKDKRVKEVEDYGPTKYELIK